MFDLFGLMCFVYTKYYLFDLFWFYLWKAFISDLPAKRKNHGAKKFGEQLFGSALEDSFCRYLT